MSVRGAQVPDVEPRSVVWRTKGRLQPPSVGLDPLYLIMRQDHQPVAMRPQRSPAVARSNGFGELLADPNTAPGIVTGQGSGRSPMDHGTQQGRLSEPGRAHPLKWKLQHSPIVASQPLKHRTTSNGTAGALRPGAAHPRSLTGMQHKHCGGDDTRMRVVLQSQCSQAHQPETSHDRIAKVQSALLCGPANGFQ